MSLENSQPSQDQQRTSSDAVTMAIFKHYELRLCLSTSPSTQVYEAWDTQLQRKVVIKRISHAGNSHEALLREARLAASLKHAAFVKIHALEEQADSLYIVMEMVHGISLKKWIQEHHGKERAAIGHVLHLAAAMQEAHALGLVYGDIKPSNLIVDTSGKLRILNFGLASHQALPSEAMPDLMDPNSSVAYMAPERFTAPVATAASDVFALGTIWYEMLHGALPHAGVTGLALVAAQVQIAASQWRWSDKLSAEQKNLILAMTCEASQRISAAQVVQDIKLLTAADPLSNSSASLSVSALQEQLKKSASQRRWRLAAMYLLTAVLVGGIAWQSKPYWPQIAKALKPYSESREIDQGNEQLVQYTINRSSDTLNAASEHFMTVLERNPGQARAVASMSLIYLFRYNAEKRDEVWLQKAKASAQQALKIDSNLALSQIADAQILIHHNKLPQALVAVDRALEIEAKNVFAWQAKMTIFLLSKRFDEAIQWADRGAIEFPKDRILPELKAAVQNQQGDYVAAEKTIRLALQRQPDSSNGYAILAAALQGQDRISDALQALQQGLQIHPSAMQYSMMGEIKLRQGDYLAAAAAYKNAVSPNQGVNGSYLRWMQYAEALMWAENGRDEGLKAYQKARDLLELRLKRAPDDPKLLAQMGLILLRQDDRVGGLNYTLQALEIAPESGEILVSAAINYELLGDRAKALKLIAKAKTIGVEASWLAHPILSSLRDDIRTKK